MDAIILSIGDELTLGQVVDTNAAWLSARLIARGIPTRYHQTVPDDQAAIVRALRQAESAADLIIVTGGLGPTPDDLTRPALAEAAGVALRLNTAVLNRIEQFFRSRGRPMTANNRVQATAPEGANVLENPCGTAPGLTMCLGRAMVWVFPGVPAEMKALFDLYLAPGLAAQTGRVILTRALNVFGLGESQVAERLGDLMRRDRNPLVGTTVSGGIIAIRIRAEFPMASEAQAALEKTAAEIRQGLGACVFGEDEATLPEAVGRLLAERRQTVATAESCTAGLVGKMLTEVPGASAWYRGGWIVYADELKQTSLEIPAELIAREGAVSAPVARAMAEQARRRGGADWALALTGIAGPEGGTPEKPVGTVWIALAHKTGNQDTVKVEKFILFGDRAGVRDRAAKTALNLLRLELLKT